MRECCVNVAWSYSSHGMLLSRRRGFGSTPSWSRQHWSPSHWPGNHLLFNIFHLLYVLTRSVVALLWIWLGSIVMQPFPACLRTQCFLTNRNHLSFIPTRNSIPLRNFCSVRFHSYWVHLWGSFTSSVSSPYRCYPYVFQCHIPPRPIIISIFIVCCLLFCLGVTRYQLSYCYSTFPPFPLSYCILYHHTIPTVTSYTIK